MEKCISMYLLPNNFVFVNTLNLMSVKGKINTKGNFKNKKDRQS